MKGFAEWQTLDGQNYVHGEVNNHHVFWNRYAYKTRLEKASRSKIVIPMVVEVHDELHAHVKAPLKPSRDVLTDFNQYMEQEHNLNPYIQFGRAILFFTDLADSENLGHAEQGNKILDNLFQQHEYIQAGVVFPRQA